MPEMTFTVRWPDGRVEDCYSPSLVVHDHLRAGTAYTVEDFTDRSLRALRAAGDRVRATYGFGCASAEATGRQITARASGFAADDSVTVVRMAPPLPTEGAS